jgi:hypothetical protein
MTLVPVQTTARHIVELPIECNIKGKAGTLTRTDFRRFAARSPSAPRPLMALDALRLLSMIESPGPVQYG